MKLYFKLFVIFTLFAFAIALYYNVRYTIDEEFTGLDINGMYSILTTKLPAYNKINSIKLLKIKSKRVRNILSDGSSNESKVSKLKRLVKNAQLYFKKKQANYNKKTSSRK
jgi:hypothetical protein